jgi:hypothetical protein
MSDYELLALLRDAVEAKERYWDVLGEIESALIEDADGGTICAIAKLVEERLPDRPEGVQFRHTQLLLDEVFGPDPRD